MKPSRHTKAPFSYAVPGFSCQEWFRRYWKYWRNDRPGMVLVRNCGGL